jgi:hypothetical protein
MLLIIRVFRNPKFLGDDEVENKYDIEQLAATFHG